MLAGQCLTSLVDHPEHKIFQLGIVFCPIQLPPSCRRRLLGGGNVKKQSKFPKLRSPLGKKKLGPKNYIFEDHLLSVSEGRNADKEKADDDEKEKVEKDPTIFHAFQN